MHDDDDDDAEDDDHDVQYGHQVLVSSIVGV